MIMCQRINISNDAIFQISEIENCANDVGHNFWCWSLQHQKISLKTIFDAEVFDIKNQPEDSKLYQRQPTWKKCFFSFQSPHLPCPHLPTYLTNLTCFTYLTYHTYLVVAENFMKASFHSLKYLTWNFRKGIKVVFKTLLFLLISWISFPHCL